MEFTSTATRSRPSAPLSTLLSTSPCWPRAASLLVTLVIEIFFMTCWLMPRLTRWLAFWIYPK